MLRIAPLWCTRASRTGWGQSPVSGLSWTKFDPAQPRFGPPQTSLSLLQPRFHLRQTRLGLQQMKFGPPQVRPSLPQTRFGPPQPRLGVPRTKFGLLQMRLGAPRTKFGLPHTKFGPAQMEVWSSADQVWSVTHQAWCATDEATSLRSHLQPGHHLAEPVEVDVASGEDDADAAAGGVRNLSVEERGEGGGASGLDDDFEARREERHRTAQLEVADGEDAFGQSADQGEGPPRGDHRLERVGDGGGEGDGHRLALCHRELHVVARFRFYTPHPDVRPQATDGDRGAAEQAAAAAGGDDEVEIRHV